MEEVDARYVETLTNRRTEVVVDPISANQLKATRWGSYGEAIINVCLSLPLIRCWVLPSVR